MKLLGYLNLKYSPDIEEYNAQLYVQQLVCKKKNQKM